eukprot:CAMPEP_0119315310 /NCGR_PEP_ID=MMETSP1333-20130426/35297_1 /TAXON_ID=418940 /ORGANISM="Scyphosphaera apsteinii, Strain RCC1455" /LENGTH=268 /DNA_ID=CAMNT_0007320627 /DNA_START=53 /DNA_END=859 /DNA_ORIENTATION=+
MVRLTVTLLVTCMRVVRSQLRCTLGTVQKRTGDPFELKNCEELRLLGASIGDTGISLLAKALADNTNLRLLDLWSNGIGPAGAAALAVALKSNRHLDKLYLNENPIGSDGAASLAEALQHNRVLTTLWLSRCAIKDAGAEALAASLASPHGGVGSALQVLDIWENEIGPKGGRAIAKALHSNHALRTLELRGNKMGDDGAKDFAAAMTRNKALGTLDLLGNGVTSVGREALMSGLKSSTAGFYLVLFEDGLPHQQWTSWQAKGKDEAP